MASNQIVLPDTLVAQLIENAATMSNFLHADFLSLISKRQEYREKLISERKIIKIESKPCELENTYAIDGAHLAEIDRASAYSVSCAVKVGQEHQMNGQSSCLTALPHVACLNSLSSGLMMMQEIMMAVEVIENNSEVFCFIDGSRISTIINIQSFYSGIARDMNQQLDQWRRQHDLLREPGNLIRLFESRDWLTPYLTNSRIIGNLKLVTTNSLIERYVPELMGRFDDKTFCSIVLEPYEAIEPIPMQPPDEPFHIHASYPYSHQMDTLSNRLVQNGNASRIFHIYYRPDPAHGVFKIEVNGGLLSNLNEAKKIFSWWQKEIDAPDIQEPYSFYIADRFAKEGVSVAKNALQEITRRNAQPDSMSWFLLQPNRTE